MAKMKEQMMKLAEVCAKEVGAGPSDLQLIHEGKSPTTKEGKCFMFCMHKSIGFQDDSGKMNPTNIYNWADTLMDLDADYGSKMKDIATKCIDIIDDSGDKCDVATDIFKCYMEKCKAAGIEMP
ncbi:hypothetical protein FQR65_LT00577 [Abscondita terminalis]|nr:hypothetical protein FQR65_LT00577 [Abscondita terminalis]